MIVVAAQTCLAFDPNEWRNAQTFEVHQGTPARECSERQRWMQRNPGLRPVSRFLPKQQSQ